MADDWLALLPWPELRTLAVALLVALVLMLACGWLLGLLERLARPLPVARVLLQRARAPARLLLPLSGVQVVLGSAPDDLLMIDGARRLVLLAMIAAFTWLGLRATDAIQRIIVARHPVDIADNLHARRIQTQTRVLVRTLGVFVVIFGVSTMLMTFPAARQFGTSLLASAGLAGLAVGFAAKPVLGNLIAGLQIALTQPIRLDDVVIVENEWGRIEEITGSYVVVRVWDDRRLVVPLQWFIENPFQNWTRSTSSLTGAVILWVDYATPLEPLRQELTRLCEEARHLWDGRVSVLQLVDATDKAVQLRVLVSSADSSRNWDLRCYVRENLVNFLCAHYPGCLPQVRALVGSASEEHLVENPASGQVVEAERQPPV
ncbi:MULTISPECIES: mechanosensitive ion channel domain-containing protein [unclassified Pseudomonas]|uniref:mechanosensitive ion channel family protein n=1 Tax=unclassified Pseudomonas TaxID=196821 RepID=UPI00244B9019|nr:MULTISPECIES: mechanosensitive ion channel domain-containing protein [unclassified Pseudomonas]MDG9927521.1 mechanosensitive ion channel family protein [Pseudomonas sp. GD04042]MDH0484450.1 mechanosensitive ion channel family protein [Pseudomonas sp. GD04015]MDH0602942.1 mechanosensitive ion channel family protein [Pseudomonas sp. GD03869]